MGRLDGRVAIITGGAKGIGVHYARALAAEGARLMIADIADGKEVAEQLARQHGANSVASAITDVSDEAAAKALVAETTGRFGQIDVLVNNAALFAPLREHIANASKHVLASRYLKRDLHPQDLLGALVFLASAESDFMSGQNVLVDGGNANT